MAKFTKAEVGFENPAKGPDHCGQCLHFDPPDECKIVQGVVRARDWCRKFASRKGSRQSKQDAHLDRVGRRTDTY